MKYTSPLRYPGGKAVLSDFLTDIIDLNDLRGCVYYEPYAGGAGAALRLLKNDVVSELYLNDADVRVYAFWQAVLKHTDRFVERVLSVPLTIAEWEHHQEICLHPNRHPLFDVGFAAFYMNRCNRSGVLLGSGPIGGSNQDGTWRMNVRFNQGNLAERILRLKSFRKKIHVFQKDAIVFLKSMLPRARGRNRIFTYLDPPYVNNGQRLYLNAYEVDDHRTLSSYLQAQRVLPWILSYDDTQLVRDLYGKCKMATMPIRYTLQAKRDAYELIITPNNVEIPFTCRMGQNAYTLGEVA